MCGCRGNGGRRDGETFGKETKMSKTTNEETEEQTVIDCPHCGKHDAVEIVFGLPASAELFEQAEAGKVLLGGCQPIGEPNWGCRSCGRRWWREKEFVSDLTDGDT